MEWIMVSVTPSAILGIVMVIPSAIIGVAATVMLCGVVLRLMPRRSAPPAALNIVTDSSKGEFVYRASDIAKWGTVIGKGFVTVAAAPTKIRIKIAPNNAPPNSIVGAWITVEDSSPSIKLCTSWLETARALAPSVPDGFHLIAVDGADLGDGMPTDDVVKPAAPYMHGARLVDLED